MVNQMKALHFGAGNIGRGFIGKLLADAGIEVIFADLYRPVIDALNSRHQYTVRIVSEHAKYETVTGVRAVYSANSSEIITLITQVDIITTAIGPTILEHIAGTVAQGLAKRSESGNVRPLNIIACENMVRGTSHLKQHVFKALPQQYHAWVEQNVGFVDSAVDRIVPPPEGDINDILEVTVEEFSEWIVDRTQFRGEPPTIPGMELTDNLMAFLERKLFTLNTGHVIAAYLGKLAGHKTIRDAILDENVRKVVKGAMQESGDVLIRRYGFDAVKHAAYIEKILSRFENPYLKDDVDRVGRDPFRKLSANDRLIKPLIGTLEYGTPRDNLAIGIAAALYYQNDDDPQAQKLAALLEELGPRKALAQITGMNPDSEVVSEGVRAYDTLQI